VFIGENETRKETKLLPDFFFLLERVETWKIHSGSNITLLSLRLTFNYLARFDKVSTAFGFAATFPSDGWRKSAWESAYTRASNETRLPDNEPTTLEK